VAGIGTNIFGSAGASVDTGSGSASTSSPAIATQTYGPPAQGSAGALSPRTGHGAGFWLAVAGVGLLVMIRQSLPR
jgi:hypothetical protein